MTTVFDSRLALPSTLHPSLDCFKRQALATAYVMFATWTIKAAPERQDCPVTFEMHSLCAAIEQQSFASTLLRKLSVPALAVVLAVVLAVLRRDIGIFSSKRFLPLDPID